MLLSFSFQYGSVIIVPEEFRGSYASNLRLNDMLEFYL